MAIDTRAIVLVIYWGAAAAFLFLALVAANSWKSRLVGATLVALVFGLLPVKLNYEAAQESRRWQQYRDAAVAHFQMRCSQAGEKIGQVFENVEGIFIANPRVKASEQSLRDQFWMGDPYGYSSYEADYPADTYLYDRSGETITSQRITPIRGFRFVELPNPDYTPGSGGSKYLRYALRTVTVQEGDAVVTRPRPVPTPVDSLKSQFSVSWADISTPQDRAFWVAGGSLKIVDMRKNSVVAERIGYVIDPRLGVSPEGRSVWLQVNFVRGAACPAFETDFHKNKEFVAKVLRASNGGSHAN